MGLCRFHEDHNPSLAVYPATGTFRCYGCQKHSDVISFLRETEQLSFSEALDALDHLPGIRH
jgi:DNA primase